MDAATLQLDRSAALALARGDLSEALRFSLQLEQLHPEDPNWPRRTALVLRRMNRRDAEVEALKRAAKLAVRGKDVLRALSAARALLEIDPTNAEARVWLSRLRQSRDPTTAGTAGVRARVRVPPPGTQTSLDQVAWRAAVGQSTRIRGEAEMGVHRIELEESAETLDLDQSEGSPDDRQPPNEPEAPADVEAAVRSVEEELRSFTRAERALRDTKLFRSLDGPALETLVERVRIVRADRNEYVLRQGQPGHELFVITSGEVGVIDEGPPQRPLARLGEGDYFGEGALVTDQPRSASVAALKPTELVAIDRDSLWAVLAVQPDLWPSLLSLFRDRAVDRIILKSPLFNVLSPADRIRIRPYFRLIEVDPGAAALEQDRMAEALSFVIAGSFAVGRDGRELTSIAAGDLFGETSLLLKEPSAVTVRARTRAYLVEFPGRLFLKIVDRRPRALRYIKHVVDSRKEALAGLRSGRSPSSVGRAL